MKFFLAVFLVMLTSFLTAQVESSSRGRARIFDVDAEQMDRSNEQQLPQTPILEQAFEKEIDSTQYIMGPGDRLLIKIWGALDNQFFSEVTPEGFVVIPSVSEVFVSGKTLAQASGEIREQLRRVFKDAGFSVRLLRVRKFRIFVVGEVRSPGAYYLRSVDRVSDALQLAGGLSEWGDDTRIQRRRLSGEVDTVNISEFYVTGQLRYNPFLSGGEVLFVPPIDLQKSYVIMEGNVGSQGVYQIRPQETLLAFLARVQAINRRSDIENVVLIREGQRHVFNLLESETGARKEMLQSGDRIMMPTNRNRIYVRGEVGAPGAYGYLANYLAKDYAGLAGVLETAKDMKEIYVVRASNGKIVKGDNVIVENGDIIVVPRRKREAFKDILSIVTPLISIGLSAAAVIRASR